MNAECMHIVLSTDNNYLPPTYITLFSMLKNRNSARSVMVHILVPSDYLESNKHVLHTLSNEFDNVSLGFIDMGTAYSSVSINATQLTTTALYRLLIPQVIPFAERCVYLDSDTVVEGDITELYDVNLNGMCVAGVKDCFIYHKTKEWKEILGIPTLNGYINSGVLLMDLRRIRALGLDKELEKAGHNNCYRYNDQDAINVVFYGRIHWLPMRFNVIWYFIVRNNKEIQAKYGRESIQQARNNPLVIHLAGQRKPWECRHMIGASLWWRYVSMLQNDIQKEVFAPYAHSHKAHLSIRAKEWCIALVSYLGLFDFAQGFYRCLRSVWANRTSE